MTVGTAFLQACWVTPGYWVAPGYLLILTNTAVFFIFWKKSPLQSPLVSGVREQATTMKSDSAASWRADTVGTGRGSSSEVRDSKRVETRYFFPYPKKNSQDPF